MYVYVRVYMYICTYTCVYVCICKCICMCVCACVCICICIVYTYMYMCLYMYMYVYMCLYMYMYMYFYVYVYVSLYVCVYVSLYVYVCVYVSLYVYVYAYLYVYVFTYSHVYMLVATNLLSGSCVLGRLSLCDNVLMRSICSSRCIRFLALRVRALNRRAVLESRQLSAHLVSIPGRVRGDTKMDMKHHGTITHRMQVITQYLRSLVSKAIPLMVFGTKVLRYWVLGPAWLA